MTASTLIKLVFLGQKSHAASPEKGVDAIAMAVEAYGVLKQGIAEEAGNRLYIFGINCLTGGTAPNMVADRCEMTIAFRYYDNALYESFRKRCGKICEEIAAKYGGSVEQSWHTSAPPVYNDPDMVAKFLESTEKALPGMAKVLLPSRLSEDFSWFLNEKPGLMFRFGTRNEGLGCTAALHSPDFNIDEQGMVSAAEAFVSFVLN